MKITMIHGTNHIGTTAKTGRCLAEQLGGEVKEFFLPRDFSSYCIGCGTCFTRGEQFCPQYNELQALSEAMDEADVLIFTSPVYVYHVTGAMKNYLDHFGYQWLIHRPKPSYFNKQAVLVTTAAGQGTKSALKDLSDNMFFWGISRVYKLDFIVHALKNQDVDDATRNEIKKKVEKTASRMKRDAEKKGRFSIRQKVLFEVMRRLHARGKFSDTDNAYWKEQGWI